MPGGGLRVWGGHCVPTPPLPPWVPGQPHPAASYKGQEQLWQPGQPKFCSKQFQKSGHQNKNQKVWIPELPWASYKNSHVRTTFSWQAVNIHNSIWSAKGLKRQSYFQSYKILLQFFFSSKPFLPFFFWRSVSHGYMFIGKMYKSIYRVSWAKYPTHLQWWDDHYQYLNPSWIFRF